MNKVVRLAGLSLALLSACVAEAPPSSGARPESCVDDGDCRSGIECENVRCRDDGTCWVGTPTGFDCGERGMCVESRCIEL